MPLKYRSKLSSSSSKYLQENFQYKGMQTNFNKLLQTSSLFFKFKPTQTKHLKATTTIIKF